MKKLLIVIISFFVIFNVKAIDLDSKNVVMYNLNNGEIIYELKKDEKIKVASLTKIMTAIVAIENTEDLDSEVVINNSMFNSLKGTNASTIGLRNNQKVTKKDLLYGTFLPSGADAANALAISVAGSEEAFVQKMNDKAKELGLNNSVYKNPVGLDNESQYSTVNEVAKLLIYSMKNDTFQEMFEADSYTFKDGSKTVGSSMRGTSQTYKLDASMIIGAKTGYTDGAGRCLASIAVDKDNNITYLLVTAGANPTTKRAYHLEDAISMYHFYFQNYSGYTLVNKGDVLMSLKTINSDIKEVNVKALNDVVYYSLSSADRNKLVIDYDGIKEIKSGTKEGTKLGKINIRYDNKVMDSFDVILDTTISFSLVEFLKTNILLVVIFVLLIILLILLLIKRRYKVKR